MYTTHTGRKGKNKKVGTASILGTIIFIGIMFSAIIPMYLVMNQADTVFEQEKHEVANLDEERSIESIIVYAYPSDGPTSTNITIKIIHESSLTVEGVRVWINDLNYSIAVNLDPLQESDPLEYNVNPQAGQTFDVRVTTKRGNIFECSSGLLEYGDTFWISESKMINVLVTSSGVVFKIWISYETEGAWIDLPDMPAQVWKIGGSAFKSFDVSNYEVPQDFKIVVKKGSIIIHEEEITMEWPDGPSVIWVYA